MPRLTNGLEQVLTNLGIVGSGYKLFFFETGTTTLKTTYSDEDLTVANTNPIVLNSAGRPSVDVWGFDTSLYRMILGTPNSVVGNITTVVDIDPVDNYQADSLTAFNPIPTAYWGATEGTSTAYTLEEPLVDISAYSNTQTFFVDFHIACGASPTLKVKDLAAITLKKYMENGTITDLVANDLQIQRYLCVNNGTNIIVLNPASSFQPIGSILTWTKNIAPIGYLECNGSAISRTTYANLFAIIGTTFGVGNGSTTFNIPDLRGYFVRGWANAGSIDSGRVFGSTQTDALQNITGTFAQGGVNTATGAFANSSTFSGVGQNSQTNFIASFDASRVARTSTETRPTNLALMYCIKY